ncbi:MAG: ABC transporter ATP-binding protein [Desulfobacterales bacterium]|nr:ABC transporter ATP-binding protein [Desulfobacterales bacterium]
MKTSSYFDEESIKKRSDTKLLKLVLPFLKPYIKFIVISIFTITFITSLNLVIPYITMFAIDTYIVPEDTNKDSNIEKTKKRFLTFPSSNNEIESIVNKYDGLFIRDNDDYKILYINMSKLEISDIKKLRKKDLKGVEIASLFLFLVVITSFILEFTQMMIIQFIGQKIMHDFRIKIFNHILFKDIIYFTRNSVGRLVTRVTNDVANMQEMFTSILTFVFKDFVILFGIIVILLSINFKLALITFIILPFIFLIAFVFAKYSRESFRTLRLKVAEINSRFSETIGGINIIQLFKQEMQNYKILKDLNHENYLAGMKQIHIFALFMPTIELLGTITLAMIIFYGGELVLSEDISIGILVAFTSYLRMFFRPIRDIAEKYNILQNALSSAERIFMIFEDSDISSEEERSGKIILKSFEKLDFKNVSFSYDNKQKVLIDLSFSINKGETIAVVGPTGSGKTTLINLIERFYNTTNGTIELNGIDINEFTIDSIRSKTAVVMQTPFLFSSSIRDNITGIKHVEEERLNEIITDSNCDMIIDKLDKGVETILSEEGSSISSGERQLISIARAFVSNPELIILDEATSYVDSDSEWKVKEAMSKLMKNRTTIIIAHRLLTAATADNILVLNNGKLIESGNHKNLMEKRGFYYKLKSLE